MLCGEIVEQMALSKSAEIIPILYWSGVFEKKLNKLIDTIKRASNKNTIKNFQ